MMQRAGRRPLPECATGNTLTQDAFRTEKFDFILANPPYGVDWKAYAAPIKH
jgi:type I restriction enzyme M protein